MNSTIPWPEFRGLGHLLVFAGLQIPTETPSDQERATLRACLLTAQEAGGNWTDCEGVVAEPCMEEPGGYSTSGMVFCTQREITIWDDYLIAWYAEARANLSESAAEELRQVQLKWIAYRDAKCALPYAVHEGGSIARVIGSGCYLSETARRAVELTYLTPEGRYEP